MLLRSSLVSSPFSSVVYKSSLKARSIRRARLALSPAPWMIGREG
jgi:hypothetical protein